MQGLAQFLEQGGTLMYVNLVVSIITLAFIVDRTIFFLGKGSVNAKAFLEQIRKLVLANNIDRAVKLCSATEAPVAQVAAGSSCASRSGFELSLVSDRGGQPAPVAAALWFARHGGVPGIPAAGWRQVSRHGGGATVESGPVTLHVIQGPDRTWLVDSGSRCS